LRHPIGHALLLVPFLSFQGCTTTQVSNNALPIELPNAWEQVTESTTPYVASSDWYHEFGSSELDHLVSLAQQNNFDVIAAQSRIQQADARARAAGAALLPRVDVTGNGSYLRGSTHQETAHEVDWSGLLTASYETDFWGKNTALTRSAKLATAASKAERDTVMLTALASVADSYFHVLFLRDRIDAAHANLSTEQDVMKVTESRYAAGSATDVDRSLQRAAVANAELELSQLEQQEMEARSALAILVGQVPEHFTVSGAHLSELSEPTVAPGIPSELLVRRPDLIAAEANLKSAHADLQATRAALFPSLTLTGSGGIQNPAMQAAVTTLTGTGNALTLSASIVQTLFDSGRRRALRDEANAKEKEMLVSYQRSIVNALRDVEVALSAIEHIDQQQRAQDEVLASSQHALTSAQLRYRAGAGDYLTVLEAQRAASAAQMRHDQYQLARLQAVVGLFRALGGGWQNSRADVTS
jgi:multidrug efflux system outer membrane protein